MIRISFNEAIIANLVDADGVDGTNIIPVFRKAQKNVIAYFEAAREAVPDLTVAQTVEFVEMVIIDITKNGAQSIYA